MDGREAMALSSGSSPYYIHRGGIGVSGSASHAGSFHSPPAFRSPSNPNLFVQSNSRPGLSGSTFSIESSNAHFGHGIHTSVPSGVPVTEPVKKKRGRPRKYAPDGQVSLGLSSMPVKPRPSSVQDPMSPKRAKGRPPGTGRKQQLALLGEWMNNSAGIAFAPHVIHIGVGEDIVARVLSFSQQRSRAVCVLSGTGTVSSVTLRQPASTGPSLTYEGHFEILCLSGSYLVAEDGNPRNRTGGISASFSSADGQVFGGAIAMLIAAGPVQVVVCSFVYDGNKNKEKQVGRPKIEKSSASQPSDTLHTPKSAVSTSAPPAQSLTPTLMSGWPGSRPVDLRIPRMDFNLTRG
uniref:AT-hook motif nuclear-localized protein n=1 Tax=Rhizophora mucronata TaxID=61149 RepID=A0A2P2LK57_RHIMU